MNTCIQNCRCVLNNIPITRRDIYTLHVSLAFTYVKSEICPLSKDLPLFHLIFLKIIRNLTEMLTMVSIFLKSPTLGFL